MGLLCGDSWWFPRNIRNSVILRRKEHDKFGLETLPGLWDVMDHLFSIGSELLVYMIVVIFSLAYGASFAQLIVKNIGSCQVLDQ